MALNFSSSSCLAEALQDSCERHSAHVALIEADRDSELARLSYGDVLREGKRLAAVMIENGLSPGDRCILLMPNQFRWVVTAAAVVWAGGVLVPIDAKLNPREQAALIAFSEPKLVIAETELWERVVPELSAELRELPVIFNGTTWHSSPAGHHELPKLRSRDDIAAIIFTSGTSGTPKGCMISDGAYLTQMESIDKIFPLSPGDRYLSIIPANHVIDFMCGFLLSLVSGATVVHQKTLRSQYIVETLRKYRITCTALVPLLLRALQKGIAERVESSPKPKKKLLAALTSLNAALTRRRPLFPLSRLLLKPVHDRFGGHLARVVVGGSYVDPELADYFYKLGIGIFIGYGLTEVCTVIALNDLQPYRGDTVGRVVSGGELKIHDANESGVGEIWVRAPFLMSGYFRNEGLTSETIVDGWLHTGDLGYLDAQGHLKLVGRSKNMIVTEGGKNIYPEDVEVAFEGLEGCEEFCVFSTHVIFPESEAHVLKDHLVLIVRPKEPADATLAGRIKTANRRLEQYKRISGYFVWHEPFPRTASLKVKRDVLAHAIRGSSSDRARIVPL